MNKDKSIKADVADTKHITGAKKRAHTGGRGFLGKLHIELFVRRLLAYMLDTAMLSILFIIISAAIGDSVMMHSEFVVFYILTVAYFSFFEHRMMATPAKMMFGLKVVDHRTGGRISLLRAVIRNLARLFNGWTLGLGYIIIIFTHNARGLHDYMSDTLVVHVEESTYRSF